MSEIHRLQKIPDRFLRCFFFLNFVIRRSLGLIYFITTKKIVIFVFCMNVQTYSTTYSLSNFIQIKLINNSEIFQSCRIHLNVLRVYGAQHYYRILSVLH